MKLLFSVAPNLEICRLEDISFTSISNELKKLYNLHLKNVDTLMNGLKSFTSLKYLELDHLQVNDRQLITMFENNHHLEQVSLTILDLQLGICVVNI